MTILEKLHAIEEAKCIYDIHYCKAGIGFLFYDPPKGYKRKPYYMDESWRQYLKVETYYPTFEKAVETEYNRLTNSNKLDAKPTMAGIKVNKEYAERLKTTHRVGEHELKPGELLNIEKCSNPNCLICYGKK